MKEPQWELICQKYILFRSEAVIKDEKGKSSPIYACRLSVI